MPSKVYKPSRVAIRRYFLKGRVVDDKNGLTKKTELKGVIRDLNADLPRGRGWTIDLSGPTHVCEPTSSSVESVRTLWVSC